MKPSIVIGQVLPPLPDLVDVPNVELLSLQRHLDLVVSLAVLVGHLQQGVILVHLPLVVLELLLQGRQLVAVDPGQLSLLPQSLELLVFEQSF